MKQVNDYLAAKIGEQNKEIEKGNEELRHRLYFSRLITNPVHLEVTDDARC